MNEEIGTEDDECPGCGSDSHGSVPARVTSPLLRVCPHCGTYKCAGCDMGDDVECISCGGGDDE